VIGPQLLCGSPDRLQRGQVEFLQLDVGAGSGRGDACRGLLTLLHIAHGQHDVRPAAGERGGGFEAKPGVGAGDHGGAAGLVGNVG
jgi:hypothetical protein